MIGALDTMQRRRWPEPVDNGFEQRQLREVVAGALQKQHRDVNIGEVSGAVAGWLAGRMQRKAQEGKAVDAGQWRRRLRLRRHPSAERFSAGNQPQICTMSL